jgi:hypothetical protein
VNDEEDPVLRNLKDKKEAESKYHNVQKNYDSLIDKSSCPPNTAKTLSSEMRLYQERLNIYFHGEEKGGEELIEPLLAKIGLTKPGSEEFIKKDYNYLLPLLVAYKHKLNTLDKHVGGL